MLCGYDGKIKYLQRKNICVTDECTFTLQNEPKIQNCRYWNPQKVNVWTGIFGQHIIGPLFLDQNLTTDYYLELFEDPMLPILNHYLNNAISNNVIDLHHTIKWPPSSPDLPKFITIKNLKICFSLNAISEESNRISVCQLANVWRKFYDHLGYCLVANGGIFEHLIIFNGYYFFNLPNNVMAFYC